MTASQPVEAPSTRGFDAASKTATCPVEGPGMRVLATQPVETLGAGTATQPVEAPVQILNVLLTSTGSAAVHVDQALTGGKTVTVASGSDSEADLQSELGFPVDGNVQGESPDKDFARDDSADQELSEEGSYRETIRGVKSFMGWHQIPDFDSASSSLDDNRFAGSRAQPTWKVSIKLPVDDWLCRKLEKLNLTISEGYPSRNAETAGLLRDQFVKTPRSSRWYDMHSVKKDSSRSTVCSWSPEPAKLNTPAKLSSNNHG